MPRTLQDLVSLHSLLKEEVMSPKRVEKEGEGGGLGGEVEP